MKKNIFILFALLVFYSFSITAQELTKAYMKYEVTDIQAASPDDPQAGMMINSMKGTITKVYFDGPKSITKISMMGGMVNQKIVTDKDGNAEMYMDAMGQKTLVKMNKADIEKMQKEEGGKIEYIHHKDKTKEILGYKAHLVTMKDPSGKSEGADMQFWVTDQIKTSAAVVQGVDNNIIGGFPLEVTMTIPGQFTLTTTLTEIKKDFDASVFEFDKKGYKEKSLEELKGMGMGG